MKVFKAGFSLIEVLVVVAIVGLLAAIAVPTLKSYTQRAKMTEVYNVIDQSLKVWQQAFSAGSSYPGFENGPVSSIDTIQTTSGFMSIAFEPGYYNRESFTYVTYRPIFDGVPFVDATQAEMEAAKSITWACEVSGVESAYYTAFTVLEFQTTYFPNCTCVNCT